MITECSHTDQSKHECKLGSTRDRVSHTESNSPATLLEACSKCGRGDGKAFFFPHLHKYQQPCALAISESWLDVKAPDGRWLQGFSQWTGNLVLRESTTALGSSVVQISNGNIDAPHHQHPILVAQAQPFAQGIPFLLLH